MTPHAAVLYGGLWAWNRTSQVGTAGLSGPDSPLSSSSSAAAGSRTEVSYNAWCALS